MLSNDAKYYAWSVEKWGIELKAAKKTINGCDAWKEIMQWREAKVGGPLPMAKVKTKSEVATAEQIATLIRIYRSAVTSGDHSLRRATAQQLALRGIQTADLAIGPKGGKS